MKTYPLLLFIFAAIAAFLFTSCEEKYNGGDAVPDPKGTLTLNMYNMAGPDGVELTFDEAGVEGHTTLQISMANNLEVAGVGLETADSKLICDLGRLAGIGNIRRLESVGWSDKHAIRAGHGYIVRVATKTNEERLDKFARMYSSYLFKNPDGFVDGAFVKYQYPFVPYKLQS